MNKLDKMGAVSDLFDELEGLRKLGKDSDSAWAGACFLMITKIIRQLPEEQKTKAKRDTAMWACEL